MTELTDLAGFAEPAKILIEKLSNAVGIIFEPRRITRKALAEATAAETKARSDIAIREMHLTALEKRTMQRLLLQETRKQQNMEDIAAIAVEELPANADPSTLDEDWLAHLFDRCSGVSEEKMQRAWANLLAREATTPGSFSRQTVNILATFEKEDAEVFRRLSQLVWTVNGDPVVLMYDAEEEVYSSVGISYEQLLRLEELGVIAYEPASPRGFRFEMPSRRITVSYFGSSVSLQLPEDREILVGPVSLSRAGEELLSICKADRNDDFHRYILSHWEFLGYAPRELD